jgi:hypothetical protein
VNWLFSRFGVPATNRLFTVPKSGFKRALEDLSGSTFTAIEDEYLRTLPPSASRGNDAQEPIA